MLRLPFTSDGAKKLNQEIFETLYFAAVESSMELAKIEGPYSSFEGSPISKGEFQYNLWGLTDSDTSGRWDWSKLREKVMKHGVRNSLLMAPMPTASTSQILGNNEAFEPYTSNIYTRRVLSGEFIVVNKHLLKDLVSLGLWDDDLKDAIMRANGSVQGIDIVPDDIKELYKNRLGIVHERHYRYVKTTGIFYRSVSILKFIYGRCNVRQAYIYAFLWLEKWSQNWNVLLENQICSRCDQVYFEK